MTIAESYCVKATDREIEYVAVAIRKICLRITFEKKLGHLGPDFSSAEILATLFSDVFGRETSHPAMPDRNRFILSKGHAALAYYATLALYGFIDHALLERFVQYDSPLSGHPANTRLAAVETSTGSLGHGLPFAAGAAIAAKLDRSQRRIYVLVGDGELQEGSNWEAAMLAAHHHLDNLVVIVDRNRLQQGRGTESVNALGPLADKWAAFGWSVGEIDGHCVPALRGCLDQVPLAPGRPTCLIANTTKGRGVSFMENNPAWHHRIPDADEYRMALSELESRGVHAEFA